MAVTRFTDASVRSLHASDRRRDYWASDPPGFGVRVTTTGRKTFALRYRIAGRLRRLTLGAYPTLSLADAHRAARKALGAVALDQDPAQDRQDARQAETFASLAEIYIEKHANQKTSGHEDRRIIANELLPPLEVDQGHRDPPPGCPRAPRGDRQSTGPRDGEPRPGGYQHDL